MLTVISTAYAVLATHVQHPCTQANGCLTSTNIPCTMLNNAYDINDGRQGG